METTIIPIPPEGIALVQEVLEWMAEQAENVTHEIVLFEEVELMRSKCAFHLELEA